MSEEKLVIGNPVVADTGETGLILKFADDGALAKVRFYKDGKPGVRHFDVKKLMRVTVLPVRDDMNRLVAEPYNIDFLHIVAAQLGISRDCSNGHYYKVPEKLRKSVYSRCLRVSVNTLQAVMKGAKIARVNGDYDNGVKALKVIVD